MEEIKLISKILKMYRDDAELLCDFIFSSDSLDMLAIRNWICNSNEVTHMFEVLTFVKVFIPPREVTEEEVRESIKKYRAICKFSIFDVEKLEDSLRVLSKYL